MASYIQERVGPAKIPPMTQAGIKTSTLEERIANTTPYAKGRKPVSVSIFVIRKFLILRSKTSVYLAKPVWRFPFEVNES